MGDLVGTGANGKTEIRGGLHVNGNAEVAFHDAHRLRDEAVAGVAVASDERVVSW
jgi:hypothetical protein